MKYFVTYCASDQDVGANPLWHSSILLSRWEAGQDKIEVLHNWGFYGMPTAENKDSLLGKIRIGLGLDIYLTGNHGMFKEEDIRFYDRGKGLHGVSFELTVEQFQQLREDCNRIIAEQEAAIREVIEPQGIKGKLQGKARHYAHEEFSSLIYALEQIKAQQQGREPRLKPFYLSMSVGFWGPSTETSKNCKTQSLDVLANILKPEQICRLTEQGNHPTIPRMSGKMEDIYLHSTGPLLKHTRASGAKEYYRNAKDDSEVKLYWTIPPQEFEALSGETNVFQMDKTYCERIKPLVKRLQALEWLVRNAEVPKNLKPYKQCLIRQIIERYTCFSVIKEKEPTSAMTEWNTWAFSLFLLPKNAEEKRLEKQIEQGNDLLNSLYMAIVDNWVIADDCAMEDPSSLEYFLAETESPTNPVEAIASYFSVKDKQRICSILGRSYCESLNALAI